MLEILIARHGQSVADIENRCEGRADFPLTDLGRGQAERLAAWIISNYVPDYIISSPLKRAAETAQIIGSEIGKEVVCDAELMERDNGLIAGLLKSEADIRYPLPEGGRKAHEPIPGGESLIDFRARAERFWSKLISKYSDKSTSKRILIVSHGGMINMLFSCFMELPVNSGVSIDSSDTCVHLLKIYESHKSIGFLNRTEHLK